MWPGETYYNKHLSVPQPRTKRKYAQRVRNNEYPGAFIPVIGHSTPVAAAFVAAIESLLRRVEATCIHISSHKHNIVHATRADAERTSCTQMFEHKLEARTHAHD